MNLLRRLVLVTLLLVSCVWGLSLELLFLYQLALLLFVVNSLRWLVSCWHARLSPGRSKFSAYKFFMWLED